MRPLWLVLVKLWWETWPWYTYKLSYAKIWTKSLTMGQIDWQQSVHIKFGRESILRLVTGIADVIQSTNPFKKHFLEHDPSSLTQGSLIHVLKLFGSTLLLWSPVVAILKQFYTRDFEPQVIHDSIYGHFNITQWVPSSHRLSIFWSHVKHSRVAFHTTEQTTKQQSTRKRVLPSQKGAKPLSESQTLTIPHISEISNSFLSRNTANKSLQFCHVDANSAAMLHCFCAKYFRSSNSPQLSACLGVMAFWLKRTKRMLQARGETGKWILELADNNGYLRLGSLEDSCGEGRMVVLDELHIGGAYCAHVRDGCDGCEWAK